jgi:hypothetical protein
MKKLTEQQTKPFIRDLNRLCQEYGVVITAHCIWMGYGEDGNAAHCISNNAGGHTASAAQAQELLSWYRDGKFREHTKQ